MVITVLITVVFLTIVLIKKHKHKKQTPKAPSAVKISDIETLLHNIEIYDGTSKGQRRVEK